MIQKNKSGFILVLTMILLAASVALVSLVINRVTAYQSLSKLWSDRQKARLLALGGIQIAMAQLAQLDALKASQDKKSAEKSDDPARAVKVLLKLGTWQTLAFTEQNEGLDGTCFINITAEEGKIPLVGLYDHTSKKWVQRGNYDAKKLVAVLDENLKKSWKSPFNGLAQPFEEFFKKNGNKFLEDVSQPLELKSLSFLKDVLFLDKEHKKPAFADVFTTSSTSAGVNPLVFSNGMLAILGLKKKSVQELEKLPTEELVKLIQSGSIDWAEVWPEVIKPLYGKDYKALPAEITALFTPKFEANAFSVVSYGKVGMALQKLVALVEKNKETPANSSGPFSIRKLYWL